MSDVNGFLDGVLSAAMMELRANPVPIYTFAFYHDHESNAVSVCADTKASSLKLVRQSNQWSMKHFSQHVQNGSWEDACLFQANVGRSLSLGDFSHVNVARTILPPGTSSGWRPHGAASPFRSRGGAAIGELTVTRPCLMFSRPLTNIFCLDYLTG